MTQESVIPGAINVDQAIEAIKAGEMVILVDDEGRENEGDLCLAAQHASADRINFMARFGRGLICLALQTDHLQRLGLRRMSDDNQSRFHTNFYVSIEAREGVTTGISAADRARTILAAAAPDAGANDIVSPGHVFPLGAVDGGVLVRSGQTEGSVDLARLADLYPAAVICEIMKDDGTMARRPDLEKFSQEHGIGIVSVAQLIEFRLRKEHHVELREERSVKPAGLEQVWTLRHYRTALNDTHYLALTLGNLTQAVAPLVRMHRGDLVRDLFDSAGKSPAYLQALRHIEREGCGALIYIDRQASRIDGIDPSGESNDTVFREFGIGAQVLRALGLSDIRLITSSQRRMVALSGFGLNVVERVNLEV